MPLGLPSSPTLGQQWPVVSPIWQYDGAKWVAIAGAGGAATPVTDRLTSIVATDDFIGLRAGVPNLVAAAVIAAYTGGAPAATEPAAFTAGQWTAAATAVAGEISFNLTAIPADGGSAITALQYRVGTGAAIAFTGTGTGVRVVTAGLSAGVAVDLQVRAVNAVGAGAWSDVKNRTPLAGGGGGVTYVGAGTTYSNFSASTSHVVPVPAGMAVGDRLVVAAGENGTPTAMSTSTSQALTQHVNQIGSIWSVVLSGSVPTTVTVTLSVAAEFRAQALAYRGVPQLAGTTNEDVIAAARDAIQYTTDATSGAVVVVYVRTGGESVTAALFNGTDARDFGVKFDFDNCGVVSGIHDGPTGSNDIDLTWSATDTGGRYITAAFKP